MPVDMHPKFKKPVLEIILGTLHAGDVAVQCGSNHGWANTTKAPARVAVILLDAQPKREASISGSKMAP